MKIKGAEGHEYNVTGQGQGNYNTVGASAGIASFLGLNAGNILGGCGYNRGGSIDVITSEDRPVSRYEARMLQELGAKDSKIALLESNVYTDGKLVEVTRYLDGKIERLEGVVRANKDAQAAINQEQAVYNGVNTATIQCIKSQVDQLFGITKLVIPNSAVCPGWGDICINPKECK